MMSIASPTGCQTLQSAYVPAYRVRVQDRNLYIVFCRVYCVRNIGHGVTAVTHNIIILRIQTRSFTPVDCIRAEPSTGWPKKVSNYQLIKKSY